MVDQVEKDSKYLVTNEKALWGFWFKNENEAILKAQFLNQTSVCNDDKFYIKKISELEEDKK